MVVYVAGRPGQQRAFPSRPLAVAHMVARGLGGEGVEGNRGDVLGWRYDDVPD